MLLLLTFCPQAAAQRGAVRPPKAEGHWGEDAVGFRWVEGDSEDGRWNAMETGPMMASSLQTPTGLVTKSIAVRVGGQPQAAVCFDAVRLNWRCGWSGGFLRYTSARYGVIAPPQIDGPVQYTAPPEPGWQGSRLAYRGLYLHGQRVVMSYVVDDTPILDTMWASHPEVSGHHKLLCSEGRAGLQFTDQSV